MKTFTIVEANKLIPIVRPQLERLSALADRIAEMRERAKAAAAASGFGGGMKDGANYVRALIDIGDISGEISALGIQLKDYGRGLIDFPCLRDERVVLLCWQLGEREEIEWWHETEAGFAGRQRLQDLFHS